MIVWRGNFFMDFSLCSSGIRKREIIEEGFVGLGVGNIFIISHIQTYIQTYIHTYIHTYIYTYIHTYIYTESQSFFLHLPRCFTPSFLCSYSHLAPPPLPPSSSSSSSSSFFFFSSFHLCYI